MLLKLLSGRSVIVLVSPSWYRLAMMLMYLEMIAIAVTLVTCWARHYALAMLIIPADALSFKPFASLSLAISARKLTLTMLLPIKPSTFVLTSILPCQHTLTFFFVIHKATLIFLLINWYKLFAWKMISTSKQDLHDFPDLSPPSAAQLLINAKDYANHRNHHCITSSRKERIKIESSSKIVMLSLDFMSSVCVDYFVFSTYSYIGPRATIPTDLWNCSNFHFLRVIGVDG